MFPEIASKAFKPSHVRNRNCSSVLNGNTSNVKNKRAIKCYHWKKIWYYKSKCPEIRKKCNAFNAEFAHGNFNREDWYSDSGAEMQLTANKQWLENNKNEVPHIMVANKFRISMNWIGKVILNTIVGKATLNICDLVYHTLHLLSLS